MNSERGLCFTLLAGAQHEYNRIMSVALTKGKCGSLSPDKTKTVALQNDLSLNSKHNGQHLCVCFLCKRI